MCLMVLGMFMLVKVMLSDEGLFFVYCIVTKVTSPCDWSVCMQLGQDLTRCPALLLGAEPARRRGPTDGSPKKRN